MPMCQGDKACVLPPDLSGYCRHHARMRSEGARFFASHGARVSVETESEVEKRHKRERAKTVERATREGRRLITRTHVVDTK